MMRPGIYADLVIQAVPAVLWHSLTALGAGTGWRLVGGGGVLSDEIAELVEAANYIVWSFPYYPLTAASRAPSNKPPIVNVNCKCVLVVFASWLSDLIEA